MKNQFNKKKLASYIGLSMVAISLSAVASDEANIILNTTSDGEPSFMTGQLGDYDSQKAIDSLKSFLYSQPDYDYSGAQDFQIERSWTDELGKSHTRFSQLINGIKVYGTSITLHSEPNLSLMNGAPTSSKIYAATGNLAKADAAQNIAENSIAAFKKNNLAIDSINSLAAEMGKPVTKPVLAYVFLPETGTTKLSWMVEIKHHSVHGFEHDIVFFDVNSMEELTRHPQVFRAKSYKTYNMYNKAYNHSSAPGTLVCTNTQSCSDNSAQRAHSGASGVYDYYKNIHGRNGINNNDMTMVSSVHTGSGWNNAVWYQNQMFYGDGDGQQFTDLTQSYDVIAHELTHGVTSYTAGLIYQNESGALNEAMSDIMGVSAKAHKNGQSIPSWLVGAEVYTPGTSGDALRYMDNPTQDGQSYDYYPERYTGSQDYGGVHLNSGIANLAYMLLVEGGKHPRNKTNIQVNGIGLSKAEKIFYRALTTYFNQSTNFEAAKSGTAQAAQDLYGASTKAAVESAWCAVGVGSCSTSGGNVLTNGQTVSGLSASKGSDVVYTMDVPSGASNITFAISGGSGDADLYVKFGSMPTDSSYDCRPYKGGNSESCNMTQTGGKYYVRLKAYSTFSGVSLTGSYTTGGGNTTTPIDQNYSSISVSKGSWKHHTLDLGSGYSDLTVTMSGGSGDADLYVRRGAQSTSSSYDCRPYKSGNSESCSFNSPASDTWYIDIYGYSSASGVNLNIKANP